VTRTRVATFCQRTLTLERYDDEGKLRLAREHIAEVPSSYQQTTDELFGYESKSGGTFSTKYSTMASGPRSTCRPVGIAWYLMSGTTDLASDWISLASSVVHIDAENWRKCERDTHGYASLR
jgi:hypothetical protein